MGMVKNKLRKEEILIKKMEWYRERAWDRDYLPNNYVENIIK